MTRPTISQIKTALDREIAACGDPGFGTWHVDMAGWSQEEVDAYAVRLVEDRLLPSDPPLVRRPYVDRSVTVRRPFDERLRAIEDAHPVADHVLVGGLKRQVDDHLTGRNDPTSPNYRQSVRVADLPEEFFEALRADMDAREARIARGPVIVSTTGLMGGAPCFRGSRVPQAVVDENLADGIGVDDLLDSYPTLDRADVLAYIADTKKPATG